MDRDSKSLEKLHEIAVLRRRTIIQETTAAVAEFRRLEALAIQARNVANQVSADGICEIHSSRNATFSQPFRASTVSELRATETKVKYKIAVAHQEATDAQGAADEAEKTRRVLARRLQLLEAKLDAIRKQLRAYSAAVDQRQDSRASEDFVDQRSASRWRVK